MKAKKFDYEVRFFGFIFVSLAEKIIKRVQYILEDFENCFCFIVSPSEFRLLQFQCNITELHFQIIVDWPLFKY